ncbi:Aerobic carbon monoxide dehydrogenase molybdenum cofactor insertion protein CoxF [Caenispirillum salinarum AK4]|uniref:Aerobic carbon monoxide dehydrogenase molybdenum cofactor insertion protein CoxF n=1 Tax=Caenispirillum salinarum AK4 TaxID=1238182 RepID=K9H2F6_9PROT|nr:XdhC family protein [Caenispirillum salinarum]EKV31752.1 Aerobic carbon monoxide dehydrogenase molybdenum cofactor insertion protein CoxF [Caenispirillum salinarum AK4]
MTETTAPAPPQDPLLAARSWLDDGQQVAVATVMRTWGSSPRPVGSKLAVRDDGEMVGSVSGGCVEGAVVDAAMRAMASGRPETLEFGVANEDAWAVGLACGGTIEIFVEAIT